MPVCAGEKLGPYQVLATIGKGGMGEVFRAHDPRVDRDVAIKVAAECFSERFKPEARAIAALNHPNICHLFDVGPNYLVMELVEGPTLAERIKHGALPFDETVAIARQIADALEAAHEKGITHRDLKPGNVKVKSDGTVKVLDFGLAKQGGTPTVQIGDSPTVTLGQSEAGVILGTAAYMAPEQAKDKPVDKRADIWAFGVVLYEMLTGRRLFQGETTTEILASVIKEEPDWNRVPAQARLMLRRCLEKDPKKRLRDIGDALPLLNDVPMAQSRTPPVAWAVSVAFAVGLAVLSVIHFRQRPPEALPVRFQIPIPENVNTTTGVLSVSPDGRKLVFAASSSDGPRLWVRSLDSLEAHPLVGAVAVNLGPIFWSPDSRLLAYSSDGKLRKIDLEGGPPQTICDSPFVAGGSWSRGGVIVFSRGGAGIMRVSAEGGTPIPVIAPSLPNESDTFPSFLEDGTHFVYLRRSAFVEKDGVYLGSLDLKPNEQSSKLLAATTISPIYVPATDQSGPQLLFMREGSLLSQAFDSRAPGLVGAPVVIADQVSVTQNGSYGRFSVSANGVLVYRVGGSVGFRQLTWFDRHGKVLGKPGEPGPYGTFKVSPDGTRAAIAQTGDIWIMDLVKGTETRLTFDPATDGQPVWSPDGTQVAFQSNRGGFWGIYRKATNGAGNEELIAKIDRATITLTDWSRDGRFLLYFAPDPKTKADLWVLPLEGDRKPFPVFRAEANEIAGYMSPDDRFIAYRSDETGRNELYVQRFDAEAGSGAAPGGKWMVSRGSAGMARWRRDGRELLYISNQAEVMAVPVALSPVFQAGPPEPLFRVPAGLFGGNATPGANIDVTWDNQKFLLAVPVADNAHEEFTVLLNWPAALKH